jgi:hypothetical protein
MCSGQLFSVSFHNHILDWTTKVGTEPCIILFCKEQSLINHNLVEYFSLKYLIPKFGIIFILIIKKNVHTLDITGGGSVSDGLQRIATRL